ncbi:DUF2771 family protein [Kutzneria viridogrisea]|uniref:Uncharacterized protein n=1 Tax=Kutzneria albida DSM 43870 TaxID=1449976 RepID=W5VZN3_9PSEU|nr:hypothetical protein KALB_579 [Kutzneria albida DSM 43870]
MPLLLAGAGLAVTACAPPPPPEVTFFAGGQSAATGPSLYCGNGQFGECPAYPQAGAALRVPPSKPVQISVPKEVGDKVWTVTFEYRDGAGKSQVGRSGLFIKGDRLAFTLALPDAADQLVTATVHRLSPFAVQNPDGTVGFPSDATWVLSAAR